MNPANTQSRCWWWVGIALVVLHLVLLSVSGAFRYEAETIDLPIRLMVSLLVLTGFVFLGMHRLLRRGLGVSLVWMVCVGLLLRIIMIPSTTMLEDDVYRYLWDGAVVVHGHSPYTYAPENIFDDGTPPALQALTEEAEETYEWINHPHLRTVYPVVAQAAFALSALLFPWSIVGWRFVLLGVDLVVLLLVLRLLRRLDLPQSWAALYWWNPLLIKEVFNSNHMDVLVLPFLLGAILLHLRLRTLSAVVALALAAGAKIWPIILLPLFLRPLLSQPRRFAGAFLLFGLTITALFVPVFSGGLDGESGFVRYGKVWEMNDAFYMLFLWTAQGAGKWAGWNGDTAQLVARLMVMGVLGFYILWLIRRAAVDSADFSRRCLYVIAALFLLSPTQFPWYMMWLLPLLAVQPRFSFLLLTALLPLYYLRFYLRELNLVDWFDYGVVWIEYLPVLLFLVLENRRITLPLSVQFGSSGGLGSLDH